MQDVCGGIFSPGEIRRSQNWIGRPGATLANARYVPPPPDAMHDCLSELERYIYQESQLPPLVRIALIHYQFEAIHPFLDGNGRIGRLLISLLLVDWGLFSQPLLNLSRFFEDNRQEYYDRLLAVSQSGQWEEWLTFFLTGVATQAKDVGQRIEALNKLRADYRQSYQDDRSRGKLAQFVDFLIGTPITSVTQARESLDIGSFTTIQRLIDKLEALGILREVTGQRRNRLYQADEILRLLTR
jgi:Fic family protein